MMRGTRLLCLLVIAAASVSCGRKPVAPERAAPAASAGEPADAAEADDEVGVSDVVDYAIGKTQLEAKKRIEAQLDAIQADRDRRIKEALGE